MSTTVIGLLIVSALCAIKLYLGKGRTAALPMDAPDHEAQRAAILARAKTASQRAYRVEANMPASDDEHETHLGI